MHNNPTIAALSRFINSPQIQNILSMLGAEMVAKLSRIVTLIALAATLVPVQYGSAMLALACHDMIRLILRCGAGSQLVQCSDADLPLFAQNAMVMQWLICIALTLTQYFGAAFVADFYDNPLLAQLLQQLAIVYLFYPLVSVRVFLIQRSNKLKYFGFCNGACVTVENLSIAGLLYSGTGIEAVVYGKFIYVFLWVILFSIVPVKKYGIAFHLPTIKHLFKNSFRLFQSEFSRSLRINADLFLAGKLLSPEIFGIYSFAKSASVAISQAISNAVVSALYPQCCKMVRDGASAKHVRLFCIVILMMLFCYLCQAILAPWYIPLFFNDTWTESVQSAVVLCLSAMPIFLLDMLCCVKRAVGNFVSESKVRLGHLLLLLCGLLLIEPITPLDIAVTVLLTSAMCLGVSVIFTLNEYQTWLGLQQNTSLSVSKTTHRLP